MCMPMKMPDKLLILLVPLKCAALTHLVRIYNRLSHLWDLCRYYCWYSEVAEPFLFTPTRAISELLPGPS